MERRCCFSQNRPSRLPSTQGLSNICFFYICDSFVSTVTQGTQNLMTGCLGNDMERMGKEQIVAHSEMLFWSLYGEKHHENVRTLPISANIQTGTSRTQKHFCLRHRAWSAANFCTDSMPFIPSVK